jgi:hypothetical protein
MNNKIDLTELEEQFKDGLNWDDMNTMELIAELKRCYEEIDDLRTGLDMAHRCLAAHNFRQCHECGDHYHDDYGPLCGHTASE